MLKPPDFLAFAELRIAVDDGALAIRGREQSIQKSQADPRYKNGRNGNQRDDMIRGYEPCAQNRAFVLAEQFIDSPQRGWVDVPGIAGNVGHPLDPAVVWCMEAVVHACGEAQSDVAPVAVEIDQAGIAEKLLQRIGKPFHLIQVGSVYSSRHSYNCVAWAHEDFGIPIDWTGALLQFPDEAIMQAAEL